MVGILRDRGIFSLDAVKLMSLSVLKGPIKRGVNLGDSTWGTRSWELHYLPRLVGGCWGLVAISNALVLGCCQQRLTAVLKAWPQFSFQTWDEPWSHVMELEHIPPYRGEKKH